VDIEVLFRNDTCNMQTDLPSRRAFLNSLSIDIEISSNAQEAGFYPIPFYPASILFNPILSRRTLIL